MSEAKQLQQKMFQNNLASMKSSRDYSQAFKNLIRQIYAKKTG